MWGATTQNTWEGNSRKRNAELKTTTGQKLSKLAQGLQSAWPLGPATLFLSSCCPSFRFQFVHCSVFPLCIPSMTFQLLPRSALAGCPRQNCDCLISFHAFWGSSIIPTTWGIYLSDLDILTLWLKGCLREIAFFNDKYDSWTEHVIASKNGAFVF